jgi:acyl-CoA synthetase (NDP forming)/GNAT superfamily N-acetyltransferase
MTQVLERRAADVLLADGRVAVIRSLDERDQPAVRALHDRASDESLFRRFFSVGRAAADAYVAHLWIHRPTTALVAVVDGSVVALATAEPVDATTEEIAFLVDDALAGHGLGSLLLEHLAADACRRDIRRFVAEVLMENRAMLDVFRDAGFEVTKHFVEGVVVLELDTRTTPVFQAVVDARERHSEAQSLAPLLHPRNVAVAGVRRDGTGVGATVLRNIQAGGFQGRVCVLHPTAAEVGGAPAYPSLTQVPHLVDLLIVAVPAVAALGALQDGVAAGVRAAVVISSGFQELGEDGAILQHQMSALARAHSMRLVGPNCLGLLVQDGTTSLNATFHDAMPPAGGLAVASQSGGVGIVLMHLAAELGLGIGSFVSLGNKADVTSNDLLAAWRDDPGVTAAALYLESFGNARKFARVAREFAEHKPLLAVVGGRSAGGRRAGASHTAASATPAVGVETLFAQAGVIGCDGAEDLAEAALLLARQPLPCGDRLAILTNAGGMGVLGADVADEWRLQVPAFSAELANRIAGHVHGTNGVTNPVDAGAGAAADDLGAIAGEILQSDEVDALVVILVATGVTDTAAALGSIAETCAAHPDKPVLLVPMGGLEVPPAVTVAMATYRTTTAAVRALARVVRYSAWRSVPCAEARRSDPTLVADARGSAQRLIEKAETTDKHSFLGFGDVADLLTSYGIQPSGQLVTSPEEASRAAERIGFPVVVKVAEKGVVHKTERRLVRVGLASSGEVLSAFADFQQELGREQLEVLVQPMSPGIELALGVVRDPVFGPLVMVAAGGVATEVWDDRIFLMPPVTEADAARVVRGLRIWPLLEGFRGSEAADVAALEQLVVDLGRMATEVPEIAELDFNPVMVGPSGCAVVDAVVRLAAPDGPGDGSPRQLRSVR